jgi:hypothetical protein
MATKKNTKKKSTAAKKSKTRKPVKPARKQSAKKKTAPGKAAARRTAAPKNTTRTKAPAKARKSAPKKLVARKKAPAKAKPVKAGEPKAKTGSTKAAKKIAKAKTSSSKAQKKSAKVVSRPRRDRDVPLDSLDLSPDVSGLESGDLEGLSNIESADSESVDELLEEGNAFEAGIVLGIEDSRNREGQEVRTREVPEDDVPQEYLDPD